MRYNFVIAGWQHFKANRFKEFRTYGMLVPFFPYSPAGSAPSKGCPCLKNQRRFLVTFISCSCMLFVGYLVLIALNWHFCVPSGPRFGVPYVVVQRARHPQRVPRPHLFAPRGLSPPEKHARRRHRPHRDRLAAAAHQHWPCGRGVHLWRVGGSGVWGGRQRPPHVVSRLAPAVCARLLPSVERAVRVGHDNPSTTGRFLSSSGARVSKFLKARN